ncbi:MAG TPA: dienelactone hydrolase family protein [Methylocella sp.]|nr:dienelactone hydrolase family protein [Methylocella sp.]
MIELDGSRLVPANGKAKSLVLLLHGVGAKGADLLDLAHALQSYLPESLLVAPNAPFPFDGASMRLQWLLAKFARACAGALFEARPPRLQWFSLRDRTPDVRLANLREAAHILNIYADRLLSSLGLPPEKLAYVGFSQGGHVALYASLRHSAPIAGAVSFCGALPDTPALEKDILGKPPILLIQGETDDVVPYRAQVRTGALLEAAGVSVEAVVRPGLGHAIDPKGIALAGTFLRRVLAGDSVGISV